MTEDNIQELQAENAMQRAEIKMLKTQLDYYKGIVQSTKDGVSQLLDCLNFATGDKG